MKITAKEGRFHKVHISVDGEYLTTVDLQYWLSCGYVSGDELDEDALAAFRADAEFRRAFNAGAQLLARREHSSKELTEKLRQKFPKETAEAAVDRLNELGMADDDRFAELFARELFERKHFGRQRILYELKLKGIDSETAHAVTEEFFEDDEENLQRILDIIEKKYYNIEHDEKVRRRAWAGLQRLGFSSGEIRRAMDAFSSEMFQDEEGWYE